YQTYGWVFSNRNKTDEELHFHWKHEDDTKCITLAYHRDTGTFLGINTFGIRMMHDVFDRWLTEKKSIDYVIDHLKEANFDPELYRHYESDIKLKFNQQLANA
ncbi:MAG: NAD(P)/FAD-dependent oxidoreductase, partial [Marinirhabdus sp.]|nr:NAD(P)/FAD-dependent oxidoreductase [Marinirhabdus sp.]